MNEVKSKIPQLGHAFILTAPTTAHQEDAARQLAAARLCIEAEGSPCMQCKHCRKVQMRMHPDVITLHKEKQSNGKERSEIVVSQIRQMQADAVIFPNEGKHKIYIILDAGEMNLAAQNAILKLLEDGPYYCIFILCTDNVDKLLPTVRSRCIEKTIVTEISVEDDFRLADEYLHLVYAKDVLALLRFCRVQEVQDAAQTKLFLKSVINRLNDLLCHKDTIPLMKKKQYHALLQFIIQLETYLQHHVGQKHIWNMLAVNSIVQIENVLCT